MAEAELKWFNLKKNKCPKCSKDLTNYYNASTKMFNCFCGFNISEAKYKKIVTGMVDKEIRENGE